MVCPALLLIPGMHLMFKNNLRCSRHIATTLILVPNMAISTQLQIQRLALYHSVMLCKERIRLRWKLAHTQEVCMYGTI